MTIGRTKAARGPPRKPNACSDRRYDASDPHLDSRPPVHPLRRRVRRGGVSEIHKPTVAVDLVCADGQRDIRGGRHRSTAMAYTTASPEILDVAQIIGICYGDESSHVAGGEVKPASRRSTACRDDQSRDKGCRRVLSGEG